MDESRDISVYISFNSLTVGINAEGVSWNPDVADDMQTRLMASFKEALREVVEWQLMSPDAVQFNDGTGENDEEDSEVTDA